MMNASAVFPTLPIPAHQGKVDPTSLPPLADLSLIDSNDQETIKHISAPVKRIQIEEDVPVWLQSEGHHQYLLFLARVAQACIGKETVCPPFKGAKTLSDGVRAVLELLTTLDSWKEEVKPLDTPQRFGNLAFRTWGQRLEDRLDGIHERLLPKRLHAFIPELAPYFSGSFGSFVRLDYGSGHELAFAAWLCFLRRIGFLTAEDEEAIGLRIIPLYLQVVWSLQDTYKLEPAGSHGVWGLDDYQFVPYIIGAAQLAAQDQYKPWQISSNTHKPAGGVQQQHVPPQQLLSFIPSTGGGLSIAGMAAAPLRVVKIGMSSASNSSALPSRPVLDSPPPFANLFTSSIARIHSLKKGPFAEHSPLLNDLSGSVVNWVKIYNGMLKMYNAECLGKKPVVQHFLFGPTCFKWNGPVRQAPVEEAAEPGSSAGTSQDPNGKVGSGPQLFGLTGAPWASSGRVGAIRLPQPQPQPLPPPTVSTARPPGMTGSTPAASSMLPTGAPWARTQAPTTAPHAVSFQGQQARPRTLASAESAAARPSPSGSLPAPTGLPERRRQAG